MSAFLEHIETALSLWKEAQAKINDLTENLNAAAQVQQALEAENHKLQDQRALYLREIETLTHSVKQLNEIIKNMEEDHKEFSKVSHIVRMERDNCRLKDHIRILERRIAFYQNTTQSIQETLTQETPIEETPVEETPIEETPTHETPIPETPVAEEKEENIYTEKKIKGVVYYVSQDNFIYTKESDNSVGVQIGTIETLTTGKTKVKWNKKTSKST
jgi:uncharacterized phage infection (PIP) family protein YhgE